MTSTPRHRSARPGGIRWALGGLLVGAAVVFALMVGAGGWSGVADLFKERTMDRSQPVLLKSVQDLSQYHAAVGTFEVVLDIKHDVSWVPDFIAGERSLFIANGTVNAFVDFAGLADGDLALSQDGTTATIRLPKATLDKPNLHMDKTYLFSQERGVINRISDAISTKDQQALYTAAEKRIATAAAESELVDRANENTRAMLVGMFNALGIRVAFAENR